MTSPDQDDRTAHPDLTRRERRVRARKQNELSSIGPIAPAHSPRKGKIVFSAVTRTAIRGRGKVEPKFFFPRFLKCLTDAGWQPVFIFEERDVLSEITSSREPVVLINLYNELFEAPVSETMLKAEAAANVVFNPVQVGPILNRKHKTNAYLTRRGILMPETKVPEGAMIFSNLNEGTSKPVRLVEHLSNGEQGRYNTRFIETRREFEGEEFRSSVRVLAVGRELVHGFVGLSSVASGNLSVHGVDTPKKANLVSHFFDELFAKRKEELVELTARLGEALGLGFYHHDFVVERDSGQIYLCETGIKFDAFAVVSRMKRVLQGAPCLQPLAPEQYIPACAEALLRQIEEHTLT